MTERATSRGLMLGALVGFPGAHAASWALNWEETISA